jgi:hypothetical protein
MVIAILRASPLLEPEFAISNFYIEQSQWNAQIILADGFIGVP